MATAKKAAKRAGAKASAPIPVIAYTFNDGAVLTIPLQEVIESEKRQVYALGRMEAEDAAKLRALEIQAKAAAALRDAKRRKEYENLVAVSIAFTELLPSQRGRSATALIMRKTGLKADAVRKHLAAFLALEVKPDQPG